MCKYAKRNIISYSGGEQSKCILPASLHYGLEIWGNLAYLIEETPNITKTNKFHEDC
jgi:hypothetical protein